MAKILIVLVIVLFANTSIYRNVEAKSLNKRQLMYVIAQDELDKDIYEVTPNWHPEIEKYYVANGFPKKSNLSWCGIFLHWLYAQVGVVGKRAWAADWIKDKSKLRDKPTYSDGFAIPRTGGSGWHVGHVSQVYDDYIITVEGNISDKLITRKIFRNKKGLTFFNYLTEN